MYYIVKLLVLPPPSPLHTTIPVVNPADKKVLHLRITRPAVPTESDKKRASIRERGNQVAR